MIRVAVCDDERELAGKLAAWVKEFLKEQNTWVMVELFQDSESLLESESIFDIIFLDIRMGEIDGMKAAKALRKRQFQGFLVFVTALEELVYDSFEVGAYDYLVKPVSKQRFLKTMKRIFNSMNKKQEGRLVIRRGYDCRIVMLHDILYCEVIDKKVYIHTKQGEVFDYYERLEELGSHLDHRFFKCHRSYLVNLTCVRGYENGQVCIEGGEQLPVSRLRRKDFLDAVLQYMKQE